MIAVINSTPIRPVCVFRFHWLLDARGHQNIAFVSIILVGCKLLLIRFDIRRLTIDLLCGLNRYECIFEFSLIILGIFEVDIGRFYMCYYWNI